jgi:hypothetical protein
MTADRGRRANPERLLGAEPRRDRPGRRRDWQLARAALEYLVGWDRQRDRRDQPHPDRERAGRTVGRDLRSRIETGRRLASGGVPVTVLRAAMVIGSGSTAFETIVALVDRLPGMVTPRWVSTPTQPIALTDVVRYLAGLCGLEKAFGASFDAGGPEVMTYREMIERIARLRGRHPLIVEVPVLSPRLSSYWLHLVTPVNAQMARPLIEGLRNPTVARDDRIRELLPFPLTAFDQAARAALRTRG